MRATEHIRYHVRVWDDIGMPCAERWIAGKQDAVEFARTAARANAFLATVFYDGQVIARFDHRHSVQSRES